MTRVTFIHLDLGIGGAESLIIAMASALLPPASSVKIYTTRCDADHCYDEVKKPSGALAQSVCIRGAFLPATVFNKFTAIMSYIRTLYLTIAVIVDALFNHYFKHNPLPDVIVVDVLPAPLPLLSALLPNTALLYYCHFPDKYLVRNTVNGVVVSKPSLLRSLYRLPLDSLEAFCTKHATITAVNSNFTKDTFAAAFPAITTPPTVLYPAINLEQFIPPVSSATKQARLDQRQQIVSFNRFERKKNIGLALEMFSVLRSRLPSASFATLTLVIAGGYDTKNVENVEYLEELKARASALDLADKVEFRPSISDESRADLLQSALCLLYTPHREHFGIIPLEAMYAGSPVIAVASGGPLETVVDGQTGYLCNDTPELFAKATLTLINDTKLACKLGQNGHEHVKASFGLDTFTLSFKNVLLEAQSIKQAAPPTTPPLLLLLLPLFYLLVTLINRYL